MRVGARSSRILTRECEMLYDGSCPICVREVNLYRSLNNDNRIQFTDISKSENGQRLLDYGITSGEAMKTLHVYDGKKGEMVQGVDGFLSIWGRLPYFNLLLPLFSIPGVKGLTGWLYGVFARNRVRGDKLK